MPQKLLLVHLKFDGLAFLGNVDIAEAGIVEMLLVGLGGGQVAMYDEGATYLVDGKAACNVVNHLAVVSVSGEAFNLGDLRFDTPVETKDRYPLQSRLLDARTEGRRFAIADDEDCAARVGYMVRYVVFDTAGFQHAARGDDDAGFVLMVQRL